MKSGSLTKVADAYAKFLTDSWRKIGRELMRREEDWVQIIAFNASRWADSYEPKNCFEFLKMPGPPLGTFLVEGLRNPNGTQRWLDFSKLTSQAATDSAAQVFTTMSSQFRPSILRPLRTEDVLLLLKNNLQYWPHPYALSVIAAERGDPIEAKYFFELFRAAVPDPSQPWALERGRELEEFISLIGSESLKSRLANIAHEKLLALKYLIQ
jgi:hypothetical protein